MLKRSLLLASALGLATGVQASEITPATKVGITPQAVGAAGVVVKAPDFSIAIEDNLDLNGKSLQIAFSAPLVSALMPATLAVDSSDNACDADFITSLTYAGLTDDGKTANYSIVSNNDDSPAKCAVTVADMHFAKGDLTTAGITAKSSFTLIGSGVSPSDAETILDLTADQFKVTVGTGANEKIDVNDGRESYAGGDNDTIVFTVGDLAGDEVNGVAVTSQEITITGDFSWADNPLTEAFDPATERQGVTPVGLSGATLVAAKSTANSLVFTDDENAGDYTLTLEPLADKNLTDADATNDVVAVQIPVQTFTVSTKVAYTDKALTAAGGDGAATGSQTVAAVAAGAHALNGASTKIFAVPFGSEVESHSIFVSNSGASTGAITGSLQWNGNDAVSFDLGNVEAGANKYINIMGALEELGEKPPFGRADITLTVNSPESDITFTAAYTTATGRANLYMQQQANIDGLSSAASTAAAANATAIATVDGEVGAIDGIVDDILEDTGTTLDGIVDDILVDTGTTLKDIVDDILEDTSA